MICVIVTGSREWSDVDAIARALDRYDHDPDRRCVLIHGAAAGADRIAHGCVRVSEQWSVVPMPAQWDRDGKAAGPIRNQRMLDVGLALQACGYELIVEAFPLPQSVGTWDMVRRAEKAGVRWNVNKQRESAC